jgi:hypothetical protein
MCLGESREFGDVFDASRNGKSTRVHGEGRELVAGDADDRYAKRLEIFECAREVEE